MAGTPSASDQSFEREKWEKDMALREREIAIKESEARVKKHEAAIKYREAKIKASEAGIKDREHNLKKRELAVKIVELRRSRFTNPLFPAILGTTVAATGTAIGAGIAAWSQIRLEQSRSTAQQDIERFKADSTLILEVIRTNKEDMAKANLKFLVSTGLITDKTRRDELTTYLDGPGPVALIVQCHQPRTCRQLRRPLKISGRSTLRSQT